MKRCFCTLQGLSRHQVDAGDARLPVDPGRVLRECGGHPVADHGGAAAAGRLAHRGG